jgi:hypothetical protein
VLNFPVIKKTNPQNIHTTLLTKPKYFKGYKGEFSTNLEFIYPENLPLIQCYRVMNRKGEILDETQDPKVKKIKIK